MTSSYFEQLGRQTLEPFTDEEQAYTKTEADLTEAVNKEIDNSIEDTRRFFALNIDNYNQTMQARSSRLKDLEELTVSGKQFWDNRKAHQERYDEYKRLEEISQDPDVVARYVELETKYNDEESLLNRELELEVASIETTGLDRNGTEFNNAQLNDLKKIIASKAGDRDVGKQMSYYFPMYLDIAKDNLIVNGKLWTDMTLSEKELWYEVASAEFIGMFVEANPNLREGQIINNFMPKWQEEKTQLFSEANAFETATTNDIVSDANNAEIWAAITSHRLASENPDISHEASIFDRDQWIDNKTAALEFSGEPNARAKANELFIDAVIQGIKADVIKEADITWLLGHEFNFKQGGRGTYTEIQPDNADKLWVALETHVRDKNRAGEELRLEQLKELVKNNQELPNRLATLSTYTNSDIYNQVVELYEGNRSVLYTGGFESTLEALQSSVYSRANEMLAVQGDVNVQNVIDLNKQIFDRANDRFDVLYFENLNKFNMDEESARDAAYQIVIEELTNSKFDEGDAISRAEISERSDSLWRLVNEVGINNYVGHESVLDGEDTLLDNAEAYLNGEVRELDPVWTVLSKAYKDMNPLQLAHDRLVALGRIKPKLGYTQNTQLLEADNRLLTHHNNPASTVQAFTNPDNVETMLTALTEPDSTVDTVQLMKNGRLQTVENLPLEKPLSEHTLSEVYELVQDGYTGFGQYGFTNEALIQLFTENFDQLNFGEDLFDAEMQKSLLSARLLYKANNPLKFSTGTDTIFRRLMKFDKEDIKEYEALIQDLPAFSHPSVLSEAALREQLNQTLGE